MVYKKYMCLISDFFPGEKTFFYIKNYIFVSIIFLCTHIVVVFRPAGQMDATLDCRNLFFLCPFCAAQAIVLGTAY